MFHPDNIRMTHDEDSKVSISVFKLHKEYGGTANLALGLNSNIKVPYLLSRIL